MQSSMQHVGSGMSLVNGQPRTESALDKLPASVRLLYVLFLEINLEKCLAKAGLPRAPTGSKVAVLTAAEKIGGPDLKASFQRYIDDPAGVRRWAVSTRAFFAGHEAPAISPTAFDWLSEARVASSYGLRGEAVSVARLMLALTEERAAQLAESMKVYEETAREVFAGRYGFPETKPAEAPSKTSSGKDKGKKGKDKGRKGRK